MGFYFSRKAIHFHCFPTSYNHHLKIKTLRGWLKYNCPYSCSNVCQRGWKMTADRTVENLNSIRTQFSCSKPYKFVWAQKDRIWSVNRNVYYFHQFHPGWRSEFQFDWVPVIPYGPSLSFPYVGRCLKPGKWIWAVWKQPIWNVHSRQNSPPVRVNKLRVIWFLFMC